MEASPRLFGSVIIGGNVGLGKVAEVEVEEFRCGVGVGVVGR